MRNSNRGNNNRNKTMKQRRTAAKKNTKNRISSVTKFFITVMVITAAVCIILFSNRNITSADESGNAVELTKYYKTITIEPGDTLWSIAKEYCTDYSVDTQDYIDEVKELNNLSSNEIHQGQHLLIAYYDTQYK